MAENVFSRLFGNDSVKARIANLIRTKHVPHAFLIDGGEGSGKMTLALEICAALNCESELKEAIPCHSCNSCQRILNGTFTDVKILKKQAEKATIGVNEVKEFRADMFLSSTESDYKIYIIDNAERMTPEAQNALLIILEEPPKNVIIMLLAEGTDKILTTIKSRTQYIAMSRFTCAELKKYLVETSQEANRLMRNDEKRLDEIIISADGRIGRAKVLLDLRLSEKDKQRRDIILEVISAFKSRSNYARLYAAISNLPTKRDELSDILEGLQNAMRDMLISFKTQCFTPIFFTSAKEAQDARQDISQKKLMKIYDIITKAHADNSKNANINLMLTNLAISIKMA